jgi:hypothetical protein
MSKVLDLGKSDYTIDEVIKACINYGKLYSKKGLDKSEKEKLTSLAKDNEDIVRFIYSAGVYDGYENW